MTLRDAIESEVGNLSRKVRLESATLEEANATIFDQILTGDFPVCLLLPFDIVDDGMKAGELSSSAELNMIFVDRYTSEGSIDQASIDIENDIIAPMRALSRQLISRLNQSDIIFEDGISSVTHRSIHEAITDAHLYGDWAVFTIKFCENINLKICD